MIPKYVTVIFPLALPKLYTYAVPPEMAADIVVGIRVEVSLKNKLYSALVAEVYEDIELAYKPKAIISIIDNLPMVTAIQLQFWKWMAEYYCCTIGEVMNVAMPSGLKLESETKVVFNGNFEDIDQALSDDEYLIAEAVSIQNELTILQIQEILDKKTVFPILRNLLDKRIISIKEELIEKFKPKTASFITLNEPYVSEPSKLNDAFDLVARSEKQTKALLAFVQISRNKNFTQAVSDICHLANVDTAAIQAMVKKDIFTISKQIVSRIKNTGAHQPENDTNHQLSLQQEDGLKEIEHHFGQNKPVLLHGITGSGKTKVYTELIKKVLAEEKQVLYLLPEIALTNHMVDRLTEVFGSDILVYHSRMNNQERVELWNAVLLGAKIVIAARSGLFMPYIHLGLIIVDEEHDPSFKQSDPNPRYNARDAAIFMSHLTNSKIILGSATPSMESFANTINDKYGLVTMSERHGDSVLPLVRVVDLRNEYKDKRFKGLFSAELVAAIEDALEKKEQVLLFQNRRGYAPTLHCHICGWKAECTNCDVHLTVHKTFNEVRCHYCGTRAKLPKQCPACGNHELHETGFGTEKIEDDIREIFPTATVARLDLDTAKTKLAFETIIHDFEEGKIDILVGTQMITKGLDFGNIALVGVLNADALLRYPDLRANERAFQLLTQVSGRAGRRTKQGKVIIQTFDPAHPVIVETMHHMYDRFFERESSERKMFLYPPYFRMIQIEFLHKNASTCAHAAAVFADAAKKLLGSRLIGPATPGIARIRGQYIQQVTIKMEKDPKAVKKIKTIILTERNKLREIKACSSVRVNIDVDPY